MIILFYLAMFKQNGEILDTENEIMFWITFFISMTSASIGLSKSLKHSVCRIMGDDGLFDGLLSGIYFIIFLACLTGFKLWELQRVYKGRRHKKKKKSGIFQIWSDPPHMAKNKFLLNEYLDIFMHFESILENGLFQTHPPTKSG